MRLASVGSRSTATTTAFARHPARAAIRPVATVVSAHHGLNGRNSQAAAQGAGSRFGARRSGAQLSRFGLKRQSDTMSWLWRGSSTQAVAGQTAFDFTVKDIHGADVSLDKFKGNVCLIVNLASQCGFTPQYSQLGELYKKYNSKGFTVLGFPCNQFGSQEPGNNEEIKEFATSKFGGEFPLFSKVDVNGSEELPLFNFLKKSKGGFLTSDIKWNFTKFLVDKNGAVVGRYGSTTTPSQIEKDIQKYLAA